MPLKKKQSSSKPKITFVFLPAIALFSSSFLREPKPLSLITSLLSSASPAILAGSADLPKPKERLTSTSSASKSVCFKLRRIPLSKSI